MHATMPLRFRPVSPPAMLLQAIGRHRMLFLTVAAAVTIGLCGIVLTLNPRFTATASVSVRLPDPDPLMPSNAASQQQMADDAMSTAEARLLTSRDIVRPIVQELRYGEGHQPNGFLAWMCGPIGEISICRGAVSNPSLETRVNGFIARLYVATHPRTRVLDIQFEDGNPEVAARAVNMLVDKVQQQEITDQGKDLARSADWLQSRTVSLRKSWLEAEKKLGEYRKSNNLTYSTSNGAHGLLISQQIAEAATALSRAQSELGAAQAQSEAANMAAKSGDSRAVVKAVDNPTVGSATDRLAALQAQKQELLQTRGTNHPSVQGIEAQIRVAQGQVGRETSVALSGIKSQLASKRAEVDRLTASLVKLRAEGSGMSSQEVELATLDHEAQASKTVYESFLAKARERSDRTPLLQPGIEFVSRASIPERKSFPSRTRFMSGSLVLGLISASAMVLFRENGARGFTSGRQLMEELSAPLLAAIPIIYGDSARSRAQHVVDYPFSTASEAIRALGTQIALAGPEDSMSRSVMITSAVPDEGKSTIALWLAGMSAQSGQRVLLIDADHAGSGIRGLTDLLAGKANVAEVLHRNVAPGIDMVAAGARMRGSIKREDVERFGQLVNALKEDYHLIIFDTPPMAGMVDALIYGRIVDHTVIVCRWQQTTRAAVAQCIERLQFYGANILGIVLSMVDNKLVSELSSEVSHREARAIALYHGVASKGAGVSGLVG